MTTPILHHAGLRRWLEPALTSLLALALVGGAFAQEEPSLKDVLEQKEESEQEEESEQTAPAAPEEPGVEGGLEPSVPRRAVRGFMAATRDGDYARAAEYLDLRGLPRDMDPELGEDYARHLKIVLDRSLWIDLSRLSDSPDGRAEDGLPANQDRLGRVEVGEENVDLLLERIPSDDGADIWKFSNATVGKLPELYAAYGYGPAGEYLSRALPEHAFLGLQLWQWVMVLGLLVAGFAVGFAFTWPFAALLRRRGTRRSLQLAAILTGPVRLLIMLLIFRSWFDLVHPSVTARAVAQGKTLTILVVTWLVLRLVDLLRVETAARMRAHGSTQADVLLRPAGAAMKIVVVVFALAFWAENLGFNATTLVAGLGIGGLAVALAAQKTLENLIGAMTLFSSAPVRVGDFCRFGERIGTVEEIGLRATRIRTLGRTIVHVPNAVFADMQIENFGDRDRIWYHPQIRLRCDTTPEQVRYILVEIRRMLYAHPRVDPDPARIRFEGIGTDALLLVVFAYVTTRDYGEFLAIAEDLNLRIVDIVAEAGTGLAVPTQTVHVEEARRVDDEMVQATAQKVRKWRERGELYLPSFPEKEIEALRGTIEYPPRGSAKPGE